MNLASTDSPRLFGMDPSQWPRHWQAAGAVLLELPGLRWLAPRVAVELRQADGRTSVWTLRQGELTPARAARTASAMQALELPPGAVLQRRLLLPPLAPADLAQAVQLEVASASPFMPEQTVSGHALRAGGDSVTQVDVAITSRRQVDDALRAVGADPAQPPEVWALPATDGAGEGALRPIVLGGFGEGRREALVRRALAQRLGLLMLGLVLLAALAVTPTALIRMRAQQAQQSFDALQKQAAPQIAQREALMQRAERLRAVGEHLDRQLALPPVLDMLSRAVPDGAWLTAIRVEGTKLVLNGHADDAAALVQRLSAQPGVHDVRLASPATRGAGAAKETFIIELNLDARRYGPVRGAEAAS